jgi:hypothetical protein
MVNHLKLVIQVKVKSMSAKIHTRQLRFQLRLLSLRLKKFSMAGNKEDIALSVPLDIMLIIIKRLGSVSSIMLL